MVLSLLILNPEVFDVFRSEFAFARRTENFIVISLGAIHSKLRLNNEVMSAMRAKNFIAEFFYLFSPWIGAVYTIIFQIDSGGHINHQYYEE